MLIRRRPDVHLTYCLNIHPGERAEDQLAAVRTHAAAVKARVSPRAPMGLGLRLGAAAARALDASPARRAAWARTMDELGMYVFTFNGFPYGRFHRARVKERVYAPDWRDPRRVDYTLRLARLLAAWMPDGIEGSISTVPVGYAARLRTPAARAAAADGLIAAARGLAELERKTGRRVRLALEPEPDCVLQRSDDLAPWWRLLRARAPKSARAALDRHLGLCLDTCHAAVEGEAPETLLDLCDAEAIPVVKIQISAALDVEAGARGRAALEPFRDAVYLHQARAWDGAAIAARWPDLDDLLAAPPIPGVKRWLVHLHVPLFWKGQGARVRSTAPAMGPAFWARLRRGACPHLEAETYTFDILPPRLRPRGGVAESVARELEWIRARWEE
jgi:sugar phosphate isomerase/epimerase